MKPLSNRIQIVFSLPSVQEFFNEYVCILLNQNFLSVIVYYIHSRKKTPKVFLLRIRFIKCKQMPFPVCLKLEVLSCSFAESI